jgi:hypothetical protein
MCPFLAEDSGLDPRIRTAIALYAFTVLGLFLLVAPWSPVWEQAVLGAVPQALRATARSGWARGLVSGLGLLDLVVAIQLLRELWRRGVAP